MTELTEQQQKELEEFNKALVASATVIPLVAALPKGEPRKKTLLALLQANARECQRLKTGLTDSDQALLAWACRNLLELVVFVKYVLQSVTNADTFSKDSIVDVHQMIRVAHNLQKQELPEHYGEADKVMEFANALKELAGITTDKYLRAGNLAAGVGKATEYEAIHKICSKYVHPTAFSILAAYEEGVVNVVNWAFFQRGALYSAEICKDITLYCLAAKTQAV